MSDYVIGIDGGGTKAQLYAADLNGTKLYESIGGGTNICVSSEEQVRKVLTELIGKCIDRLGGKPKAVCIGSAGIVSEDSTETMKRIIKEASGTDNAAVFNDAVIALRANLGSDAGMSITAGTGTICLAQDGAGNLIRVSGWGHICSDEGSAYYIVKKALEKVCLAHDGRIGQTGLTGAFFDAVKVTNFDDLIAAIYSKYIDKDRFASLARTVDETASRGDAAAADVLNDAGTRLYEICSFAASRLYDGKTPFRVVKNGGVLKNCIKVRDRFDELMKGEYPLCSTEYGKRPAVMGAVDCALAEALKDS